MIKKILFISGIIVVGIAIFLFYWFKSLTPDYKGELNVKGLKQGVEVFFDTYGVPHIYAKSEEDAYFALGYIVASERLFQMELVRRLGAGRLSEILGRKAFRSDHLFRTLNLKAHADWSAKEFERSAPENIKRSARAYLEGVNEYIREGKTPIEFTLAGIEKTNFSIKDVFLISGYMAFGFAEGFRTDPMVERLYLQVGNDYMRELELGVPYNHSSGGESKTQADSSLSFCKEVNNILKQFPVAPWVGSNSWAISPKRTKNKKAMLCNDTHMGYMQPSAWYEAHLEYPGFRHYGNYLAGVPFALAGHSDYAANGITMLENDDTDFYTEQINGDKVQFKEGWIDLKKREERILVKDSTEATVQIFETPHGPVIDRVNSSLPNFALNISLWWGYLKFPSKMLEFAYGMNHAKNMEEGRSVASLIHSPGLSVVFADNSGNIARWASAKMLKRRAGINSMRFMNGSNGKDEPLGYYEFEENPHLENPESGVVVSANEKPDSLNNTNDFQGYYLPNQRFKRINKILSGKSQWEVEDLRKMITDDTNRVYSDLGRLLRGILGNIEQDAIRSEAANRLSRWEGEHKRQTSGAVVYYKWIYNILKMMMVDEIGQANFDLYIQTHFFKNNYPHQIQLNNSLWWDDKFTRQKESRQDIIKSAWNQTMDELISQLGKDLSKWTWERVHQLEIKHPLGQKFPLNYFFNIGPHFVPGGNETINNTAFNLNPKGEYEIIYGPAMRRIVDFSDVEKSLSILPSGQSGYFLSPHYDDQTEKYLNNGFRFQLMNKGMIKSQAREPLIMKPSK